MKAGPLLIAAKSHTCTLETLAVGTLGAIVGISRD